MIKEKRTLIKAGGGLVENENGEALFIYRRGKWDLPKGKLDPHETLSECALREVSEETGVSRLKLEKFLLVTEHEYEEMGKPLIKETHWYLMKATGNQALIPQTEEDITELKWIGAADLEIVLENTYPGIVEVLKAAGYSV